MNWIDGLILAAVTLILGLAVYYIYRTKKKGKKCVGCPCSGSCNVAGCSTCCNGQKTVS